MITSPVRLTVQAFVDRVAVARRSPARTRAASEADETYRKAALFVSRMVRDGRRSLLLCSARRGEGTTTAVLSLAHQLQECYALRPLVVELDRPKPALGRLFALDAALTLHAALDGLKPAAECIQVTRTGLRVIPGGAGAGPHPRLASGLRRVLSEVEETFDIVLVDGPPLLTHAEALIASTVVREVVLVVEAGRTSCEVLERVKRELAADEIRIAGTVLVKHKRVIPRWIYRWVAR